MSVINQMLRELDARGAAPADAVAPIPAEGVRPRRAHGTRVALAALGAGAVVLYGALSVPAREATPGAVASTQAPATGAVAAAGPSVPVVVTAATPAVVPAAESPRASSSAAATKPAAAPAPRPVRQAEPAPAALSAPGVTPQAPAASPPPQPMVVKQAAAVSPEAEARELYDEAGALLRAGRVEAANERYRRALARKPDMHPARLQLARVLQDAGRGDDALYLLQSGHEQYGDDALAVAAGRLLADRRQAAAALAWLARGEGGLAAADHALTGALLSQTGRHEEAVRAYRRALAADPGQGGWFLGLGLALEARGQPDEAKAAYRAALDRGGFQPAVVHFLRERTGEREP